METNLCGNCDYALITACGFRMCVRHRMYVTEDAPACKGYFNYNKTRICNQIKHNLTKEGK